MSALSRSSSPSTSAITAGLPLRILWALLDALSIGALGSGLFFMAKKR